MPSNEEIINSECEGNMPADNWVTSLMDEARADERENMETAKVEWLKEREQQALEYTKETEKLFIEGITQTTLATAKKIFDELKKGFREIDYHGDDGKIGQLLTNLEKKYLKKSETSTPKG